MTPYRELIAHLSNPERVKIIKPHAYITINKNGNFRVRNGEAPDALSAAHRTREAAWADAAERLGY